MSQHSPRSVGRDVATGSLLGGCGPEQPAQLDNGGARLPPCASWAAGHDKGHPFEPPESTMLPRAGWRPRGSGGCGQGVGRPCSLCPGPRGSQPKEGRPAQAQHRVRSAPTAPSLPRGQAARMAEGAVGAELPQGHAPRLPLCGMD